MKHSFAEFDVTVFAGYGKWFTFYEGDFDSIDLEDVQALIHDLRSSHDIRPRDWINGLEALKRYV